MFNRSHITHVCFSINCTDNARNEKEVLVSFRYRNLSFEYPIRVMMIPGKEDAYYFDEAKVLFEADYKSGKLRKYLSNRYGPGHLKKHFPRPLLAALVVVVAAAVITPILIVTLGKHQTTYTVTFDLNGGQGDAPAQTFKCDDKERLVEEPDIPTYGNYDFIGWYLNDTDAYDFSSTVNSDLTLHAHWDLNDQDAVTLTKNNETKSYHTLEELRDAVNNNTDNVDGFDGWTIKLNEYINLQNQEWTPIGTGEHPFKGMFNGNDKAVYNYKIVENKTTPDAVIESLGGGLFGYVNGSSETLHNDSPLEDFYNTETYKVTPPEENSFSCVIKNLKLRHVTTTNGGQTNDEDYTAALVSSVNNAYISNIRLNDATINADNKVGGIVGIVVSQGVAVFDKLITDKSVSVNGNGNHVAGIYSRVHGSDERVLALNCINNATVDGKGINTGGITGQSKNTLFNNCINNGTIIGKSRTAGIATDVNETVFIRCINNGNVSQTQLEYVEDEQNAPGGIASFAETYSSYMYECKNTGTIGSDDNKKTTAGIISSGLAPDSIIKDCINIGEIKSTHAYDICDLANVPTIKTETSLKELNSHLQSNKYIIDNDIVLTNDDKTLTPNDKQEKIELNNLNGDIILDLSKASSNFTLDIDNCNVSIVGGNENKTITIVGGGNNITIDSEMNDIYLSNDSKSKTKSTITINHKSQKITLDGEGETECDIEENTSVDRVSFIGTGTFTLVNKGTISHKTSGTSGNEHTVCTISKCNITIYNYGKIKAEANAQGIDSYAFLFNGGSLVHLYADNGSYAECDSSQNHILTAGSAKHVYIHYRKNAMMKQGNTESVFCFEGLTNVTSEEWPE